MKEVEKGDVGSLSICKTGCYVEERVDRTFGFNESLRFPVYKIDGYDIVTSYDLVLCFCFMRTTDHMGDEG